MQHITDCRMPLYVGTGIKIWTLGDLYNIMSNSANKDNNNNNHLTAFVLGQPG